MESNWKRVGPYVRSRRRDLRLRQEDIASRGGPSPALVRQVENGRYDSDMQDAMRRGFEVALQWQPGSLDAILQGGDPTELRTTVEVGPAPGGDEFVTASRLRAITSRNMLAMHDEAVDEIRALAVHDPNAAKAIVADLYRITETLWASVNTTAGDIERRGIERIYNGEQGGDGNAEDRDPRSPAPTKPPAWSFDEDDLADVARGEDTEKPRLSDD